MNKEEQKQHIIDLMNMGDYKQKTALQQLIDKFEEELSSGRNSKAENIAILWANIEAKKLLETELEQIGDAFTAGKHSWLTKEQYIQEKFKQ